MGSDVVYVTLWIAAGFLAGSIPFGYLVARAKGMDIRKAGSGNIGMTNVWRVFGWKYGVLVLILDAAKGFLPVLACQQIDSASPASGGQPHSAWIVMAVGLAAILGHSFTPWLRFKGGKGVATGLGVLIALLHGWVLVVMAVFLLTLAATRYVSVASMVATTSSAAICLLVPAMRPYLPFTVLGSVVIIVLHKGNIRRLLNGTENRVGRKKPEAQTGS